MSENEYQRAARILKERMNKEGVEITVTQNQINAAREEFVSRFDYRILVTLSDEEMLSRVFYTDGDNSESLCCWMEMNRECKDYFGSISGGSAFKFGLFQRQGAGVWTTGSSQKSKELSYEEAVLRGGQIVNSLVRGAEIIENATLLSLEDYEKLDADLKAGIGEPFYNWTWFHKYYSILFPDKITSYHNDDWQCHVLRCFGIRPSEKRYVRSGQIVMIQRYADYAYKQFGEAFYDIFGGPKIFVRVETHNDEKDYIDEWKARSVIGIGWKKIGSLEDFAKNNGVDKNAIAKKLQKEYYPNYPKIASSIAREIVHFYETDSNSIFVAMDGEKLIAFVDEVGSYIYYNGNTDMSHLKTGKWRFYFGDGETLPTKSEEIFTSCSKLKNEENIMFLYQKYYYSDNRTDFHEIKDDEDREDWEEYEDNEELIGDEMSMLIRFQTNIETNYERNRIVFGAPGTGKSFKLKNECEDLLKGTSGTYERVTFYPDYSYSQFVGTYKPVMDDDGRSIRYDFVPGPFLRVYVEALKSGRTDDPQPHLLLIEEINRAKVAAVFGDVFQLLDRDDGGVSEYEIQASEDIRRYLVRELGGTIDDYKKICIPDNMFIWATMNSADQGVFPMDTAFKRRWNFEYLGINEQEDEIRGIGKIILPGSDEPLEWNTLRKAINAKMSSNDFKINEDKMMGPFFLAKKDFASDKDGMIIDTEKFMNVFKSKVIMYLYEDAIKQGRHRFFDGCDSSKYSAVCEAFDESGIDIFGSNFAEIFYREQG